MHASVIIEYGSTLYIGIHKVFQLLTYNSKMRSAVRLKVHTGVQNYAN